MSDNIFSEYTNKLKSIYAKGDIFIKLILIIAGLYIVFLSLDVILYKMFEIRASEYLLLSGNYRHTIKRPWTIVSYLLVNKELVAMALSCISLWALSKMNDFTFNNNQILNLIFYGSIFGAIFYTLGFMYKHSVEDANTYKLMMYGFTPATFSMLSALAMQSRHKNFILPMFGRINLSAFLFIIIGAFFASHNDKNTLIMYANAGGIIAGILLAMLDTKGKAPYINFTKISYLLRNKPNEHKKKKRKKKAFEKNGYHCKKQKNDKQKRVDIILNKIKEKGYEGLSAEEKREIFEK
ncbi:MAG: rhomboid family intramembrane serine protease [Bacteroidales bacterium]